MQIKTSLKQQGFFLGLKLSNDELKTLRQLINDHYFVILKKENIKNLSQFQDLGIKNYHQLAHFIDHSKLWPKQNRILDQIAINQIQQMNFYKTLQREFGNFEVSDEEEVGREEFYFRICRPNEPKDFGPLHADAWFWELGHGKMPANKERVKVWIAVYVEKGLNGFRYVAKSHLENIPYHGVKKAGFNAPKPQIDVADEDLNIELFNSDAGEMIVFHDKLLHGGAENKGQYTRVSLEFTMLIDK